MDLTQLPGRPCPIAGALELVGDRWSLLVVREVDLGSRRTEIQKGTGAPRDRLAARLKALVDAGSCTGSGTATRRSDSTTT